MHSKSSAGAYSPTRPANGLFSFLKPSRGGYSGAGTRSVRTRGNFDDQAEGGGAWDARIEEGEEFAYHGAAKPVGVMPRGREQDLGAGMETERGRSRSRGEGADEYATPPVARNRGAELYMPKDGIPAENPFEQDLRRGRSDGFGDVGTQGGRTSIDSTKRSIFREGI